MTGLIFDIQGHSVHDGPGTRTTVFMSGCNLNCSWCCNPEGLFHQPVMMHKVSRCIVCGECIKACPQNAITYAEENKLHHDRSYCDICETKECIEVCMHEAATQSGKYYTVDELMKLLRRDSHFWGTKGGVTFSGGEPLLQREFIMEALRKCKKLYMNIVVETTCFVDQKFFMEAMSYVDWVFTDIKHMNPCEHKKMTGADNKLILQNIRTLAEKHDWNGFIVPRVPIIPGFNDSEENIHATAKFVKDSGLEVINILPFHRLGESKYRQLGMHYNFAQQQPPTDAHMLSLKKIIESEGIICYVGYETAF